MHKQTMMVASVATVIYLMIIQLEASTLPTTTTTHTNQVRQRLVLPKFLTYEQFTKVFRRHYVSTVEFLHRQRIFLGRLFQVFVSSISYDRRTARTYKRINRMSDWTNEERRQLLQGETDYDIEANIEHDVSPDDMVTDQADIVTITGERTAAANSRRKPKVRPINASDTVWHDLRQTGCFNEPQHQGKCGSCYALTAIAQLEFLHCIRTPEGQKRQPIKFSEQHLIDCGKQLGSIKGCRGGKFANVLEFASKVGLKLKQDYSNGQYLGEEQECLVDDKEGQEYSTKKLKNAKTSAFKYEELEKSLKANIPLYMSIRADPDIFMDYGGGVDMELNCTARHAMLLVGSGKEDDQEYWLLRNTFGTDWGESGYYKMSKQSKCLNNQGRGYFPSAALSQARKLLL